MSRDALVVGIGQYSHANPLPAAAQDAEAVAQILERYGDFNVKRIPEGIDSSDPENRRVRVAQELPLHQTSLEDAIEQLFLPSSDRQIPDTALLFFSGHGWRKEDGLREGFLATSEMNPSQGLKGIGLAWLCEVLKKSPIKQQIVWLDCCYAGALLDLDAANPQEAGLARDRCFIAASRSFETAEQDLDSNLSAFSKALIQALDPTTTRNGDVSSRTLSLRIKQHFPQTTSQEFVDLNLGEIVLTHCDRDQLRRETSEPAAPIARPLPPPGFERVGDLLKQAEDTPKSDFYEGVIATWSDIRQRRDAERDAYSEALEWLDQCEGGGRIPLLVITGRAGDGKTTLLMRLAATLADRGREVWYTNDGGAGLPITALSEPSALASPAMKPTPKTQTATPSTLGQATVLCLDEFGLCDRPLLESQLKHLHTHSAPITILATARPEQWRPLYYGVEGLANVFELKLANLSDSEIDRLLDRLTRANALGKLQKKSVPEQRQAFREKNRANKQLLLCLFELRKDETLVSYLRRHLRDIERLANNAREQVDVAEACRWVCAVHAFGLGLPETYLRQLVQIPSYLPFDRAVLQKASSFLVKRTLSRQNGQSETYIYTRHALVAEMVWRNELRESQEYGEDPLYRLLEFIKLDLKDNEGRNVPKLFQAFRQQFNYHYKLDLPTVRPLFELASQHPRIAKYVLHIWAGLERRAGNIANARELYARALKVAPDEPVIYQAWAHLESRQRNYNKARELFERGTKADPKNAPLWQAWAVMEANCGETDKARELFERGTKADPKHAPLWGGWSQLERKQGNTAEADRLAAIAQRYNQQNA